MAQAARPARSVALRLGHEPCFQGWVEGCVPRKLASAHALATRGWRFVANQG